MRRWGILVVVLCMALAACNSGGTPPTPKPMFSDAFKVDISARIQEAQKSGLIKKIDAQIGKVWIQELTWASINVELKEDMTRTIAAYCAIQQNTEYLSVDVIGWMTGKKLGSYSTLGGFKVY